MTELQKKIDKSIMRLKEFEPPEGFWVGYSGGKDSDCLKILCKLADVKHDLVHSLTTVDAPETVRYIKSQPDVRIEQPKLTMWRLIEKKMFPPTRLQRYCCQKLKECGGKGRLVVTGVRWSESIRRKTNSGVVQILGKPKRNQRLAEKVGAEYIETGGGIVLNMDNSPTRRMAEQCYRTSKTILNPIIEWTDDDVWNFLHHYGCNSNPLYQCGYSRVGCIGCPMAGKQRYKHFERYPKYKENYIRAFGRMLERRKEAGKAVSPSWTDGESVMRWWLGEDLDQITIEESLRM